MKNGVAKLSCFRFVSFAKERDVMSLWLNVSHHNLYICVCVHRRLAHQPIYLHAEEERWTGGRSSPVVLVIILQVTKDTQVKLLMNIYISDNTTIF